MHYAPPRCFCVINFFTFKFLQKFTIEQVKVYANPYQSHRGGFKETTKIGAELFFISYQSPRGGFKGAIVKRKHSSAE